MQQFNFPTTVLYGDGALDECANRIHALGHNRPLLVSDQGLVKAGIVATVTTALEKAGLEVHAYVDTQPNPIEEDAENGGKIYLAAKCDCVVALGGGSPMDAGKVIQIRVSHEGPLKQFDDAVGGSEKIVNPLPPIFAIPTTAGTGSEVGRCGVLIMKESGLKTIFFHPDLLPKIAVLEPTLTTSLPPNITAATGIDAFTHCLEAYFSPTFHPMADGIALEGMALILDNLSKVVDDGSDVEARAKMLIAATMGATAFQKGLGMIHSMAHPLSSEAGMHHGLANALLLPTCISFLEGAKISQESRKRLENVRTLFAPRGRVKSSLAATTRSYFDSLGIRFGLKHYDINESDLEKLADKAIGDPCHADNMIAVTRDDLLQCYKNAY